MNSLMEKIKLKALSEMETFKVIDASLNKHFDRWPIDRNNAMEYFDDDELKSLIVKYFNQLQQDGEEINHIDIAGRACFSATLVNCSYMFAYSNLGKKNNIDKKYYEGDLLDGSINSGFRKMLSEFRENNTKFNIITFEPVGAFSNLDPSNFKEDFHNINKSQIEAAIFFMFLTRFLQILPFLKKGGLFYLGSSNLFNKYYFHYTHVFVRIFEKLGLEILFSKEVNSSYKFLLRKK